MIHERSIHTNHGATFIEREGRTVVKEYGRPDRTVLAVRNGAGVIEMGYGIIELAGDDSYTFIDNTVSNAVPQTHGHGVYALLLNPQGQINAELYIYNAGNRILCFCPYELTEQLVEKWSGRVFIQDIEIADVTDQYAVFGVHGSQSTEKIASVLNGAGAPEPALHFVQGTMGDVGVTVVASDAPTGEEGYEVICDAETSDRVLEILLTLGLNAVPFGFESWDQLLVEAGTPQFHSELSGNIPNVVGVRNALDFEKGCYVGQEIVSKVENRGRPSRKLVGIRLDIDSIPAERTIMYDGTDVGTVCSIITSPTVESVIGLGLIRSTIPPEAAVSVGTEDAAIESLPFVSGSATSARVPTYPSDTVNMTS